MNLTANTSNKEEIFFDPCSLKKGLNYYLQIKNSSVCITDVQLVPSEFDARKDAIGRTYMYRVICPITQHNHFNNTTLSMFHGDRALFVPYPLRMDRMQLASQYLLGEQDFSSFRNSKCQSSSPFRNVKEVEFYSSLEDEYSKNGKDDFMKAGLHHLIVSLTLYYINLKVHAFMYVNILLHILILDSLIYTFNMMRLNFPVQYVRVFVSTVCV